MGSAAGCTHCDNEGGAGALDLAPGEADVWPRRAWHAPATLPLQRKAATPHEQHAAIFAPGTPLKSLIMRISLPPRDASHAGMLYPAFGASSPSQSRVVYSLPCENTRQVSHAQPQSFWNADLANQRT